MIAYGLRQVSFNGYQGVSYGLYDTFVVSFSRYEEFRRLINRQPIDERSRVIGSAHVGHSDVFYCDEYGAVTKYKIEGD